MAYPMFAADFTNSNGRLSDRDFYRAVTCKAAPKSACQSGVHHWPSAVRKQITVSLGISRGASVSASYARAAQKAMDHAISQINAVGAGVQLRAYRGPIKSLANIRISLVKPKGKARRVAGFKGPDGKPLKIQNALAASSIVSDQIVATRIAVAVDRVCLLYTSPSPRD